MFHSFESDGGKQSVKRSSTHPKAKMMKLSLCIFIVGVLIGGAASDFLCIVQQLVVVTPDHFFSSPASSCQDLDTKFNQVRKDLKKCTSHRIDLSLLESLHKDFCTPYSDYRIKFNRQESCLSSNIPNIRSCLENMSFSPRNILTGTIKDMCTSLSEDTSKCLNDKVGRPCGDGGLEVYQRITKSSEPFFTGICLEAAGVKAEEPEFLDEVTEVEEGLVDAGVAEGAVVGGAGAEVKCEHYVTAAASSAIFWNMLLLGVLLTVTW